MIDQEVIDEIEREAGGEVSFVLEELPRGIRAEHEADEPVPTASVIKLPILVHVALAVEEGTLAWDETLTLAETDKAPGTGILKGLSEGLTLSVRDLCFLMTVLSDNTATNMLIERVGIDAINARIRALGLQRTRLIRKAYSADIPGYEQFGFGVTTPRELAVLLRQIATGAVGTEKTSSAILAMLAEQQDRAAIPRYLPQGWSYAGKTGQIAALRGDAGIVTSPEGRRYVLACFCRNLGRVDWTVDNPGLVAIARLARELLL